MEQTDRMRLNLVIDSEAERVVYAETDKKFIDFLFNLLSLPLGAVIHLLKKEAMVGCLGNVYESLETSLNEAYFLQSNQSKDTLLKPKLSLLLPNIDAPSAATATIYVCGHTWSCTSFSDGPNAFCPTCAGFMRKIGKYVRPRTSVGRQQGFVKDSETYVVMDDLSVTHISDFSIATVLDKFNVKDVDSLEEKLITLDVNKVNIG